MKTIPTQILGGPSDGITYDRPVDQVAAVSGDGVRDWHYELNSAGRMVWTGEWSPLGVEDLEREIAEVLEC